MLVELMRRIGRSFMGRGHTVVHVVVSWVNEKFLQHWLAEWDGAQLKLARFLDKFAHDADALR